MNIQVFSLYWDNIDDRIVWYQNEVMNKMGISVQQHRINGIGHAEWMSWIENRTDSDAILYMDIDRIITHPQVMKNWVIKATNGELVGNIQSTNHLGVEVAKKTFAAPSFLVLNKKMYHRLGKPSFQATPYGDVAQTLTDTWRMYGVPVHLIPITHFEKPKWALAGVPNQYGIGTTFGGFNYHLFESRQQENIELFVQKCMEVLK